MKRGEVQSGRWRWLLGWAVWGVVLGGGGTGWGEEYDPWVGGGEVVLLYNTAVPESLGVAEHYALRRGVPTNRWIGLELPTGESITRQQFVTQLERPLVRALRDRGLVQIRDEIRPATETAPGSILEVVTDAPFRCLVVCYGVPLKIGEDAALQEAGIEGLPETLRVNRAAVDAELTALPMLLAGAPRMGPIGNRFFGATNASVLHPRNGVLVVGRLDGPTAELARGLVDRAIEAERHGLVGRGYFDVRSIGHPAYQVGDQWISNAWAVVSRYGFDTHLDREPGTLPAGFPMSHTAFYAGWYDGHVSGPFQGGTVEFTPGAVGYHLHSFSAATLRAADRHWVGPLVAAGVTATMGMVHEPYLQGTPDVGLCFARLLFSGFTWGEAALVSQRFLSWQLTVVGDPLYRPFRMSALDRAKQLAAAGDGRLDWLLVSLYNRKREASGDAAGVLKELEEEARLRFSAILQEKRGDLLGDLGRWEEAGGAYREALRWPTSGQQRRRLQWLAGEAYEKAGRAIDAYEQYRDLAGGPGAHWAPAMLYERLEGLASGLGRGEEARRWGEERNRLQAPSAP
ncbi:MAG: TIGR03790 family protein [Verrucomicrobiae bacterium]|nr:TIGR03790 family protein [Verrucomicrobiae bacterium]